MNSAKTFIVLAVTAALISGCGLFGGKDDEELPPSKLLKFKQTLKLKKVWSAKLGDGSELLRLALSPAGDGTRVYAASQDGVVSAYDPANGKRLWRTRLKVSLSAGPGVDGKLVVVAGRDGDVIALDAADGSEVWRAEVIGESLARPLVIDRGVVIYTIDGRLRLLSPFDGSERWTMEQEPPLLTLRGSSSPIVVGSTIMVGFANGRLAALDADTGNTEWEAMISPPSGRSDLDRLADVDGQLQAVGQDVYVSGYQGRLVALAAESGQVLWARELSTFVGVGTDWNNIYLVTDEGSLVALTRRNGEDIWQSDALLRREPTAPVAFDLAVVVGDFEGYVHLFSAIDGQPVARVRVGKGNISGSPVVIGDRLYVQSESGALSVYAVPAAKRKATRTSGEGS